VTQNSMAPTPGRKQVQWRLPFPVYFVAVVLFVLFLRDIQGWLLKTEALPCPAEVTLSLALQAVPVLPTGLRGPITGTLTLSTARSWGPGGGQCQAVLGPVPCVSWGGNITGYANPGSPNHSNNGPYSVTM
jgi:hypothetical protein